MQRGNQLFLTTALALSLALGGVALGGDFDARVALKASAVEPLPAAQQQVLALRQSQPELQARFDPTTGALRTLSIPGDALSAAAPGTDGEIIATEWLNAHRDLLGLSAADLADYRVTDRVVSKVGGTIHLYLQQSHQGLPVYNGQLQVHLDRDGRILAVNNAFVPDLALAVNTPRPTLTAAQAVAHGASPLLPAPKDGLAPPRLSRVLTPTADPRLMWLPIRGGEVRLVWNFQIDQTQEWGADGMPHLYDFTVDAVTGQVWTRYDLVDADDYRVYPVPVESPTHTTPLPPADARVLVNNPADATASPFAWHDTNGVPGPEFTTLRGNNVRVTSPGVAPNCGGSILCDFPVNFALNPSGYVGATSTNLFYWVNILHDVQFQYGFDPPAGNFQVNNYGLGGLGNDAVLAQDQPGCTNNAFFSTPPDGSQGSMLMCIFTITTPFRAASFDAGIVAHEMGHGFSNRLVGGPNNVNCLNNNQQPGEGLSDWWSLVYTHEVGDQGSDTRGVGTYVLGQPANGPGIRTQPYSTDPTVNTHTYTSIGGMSVPHGVGEVWAQGAWEAYWSLVDKWGFDPDLYNALGGAGNQRMKLYVNEGLKFTACSPTFLDVRDGILQAATVHYGGVDVCRLWTAFAAYGLGSDATTAGPNSLSATNGFAVPAACQTDVFTKDNTADNGTEPNPYTGPYWQSPDIWVRNDLTNGPHQNPEFGQTNYIHVKVRQNSAVEAHNVPVRVYFANASTGLAWPTDWTLIDTGVVTNLAPGNDTEVVVPWNPPGTGHFCLLSRIDTGQDPMTFVEGPNVNINTKNNNNIAWKNTNVVDLIPGFTDGPLAVDVEFIFRNPDTEAGEFFLIFQEPRAQQKNPFLNRGQVIVVLPEELVALLEEAGVEPEGFERIDDRTFAVADPQGATLFVPLAGRQEFTIEMSFRDRIDQPSDKRTQYLFDVIQTDTSDTFVGGVGYIINALLP